MILVDFSKIAHWESAGGKVNFQVIAVLNWRVLECYYFIIFIGPIIVYHIANAIQTVNGMHFSVYESLHLETACICFDFEN